MTTIQQITPDQRDFPAYITNIAYPPKQLYFIGDITLLHHPSRLAVVGSRAISPYGKLVTEQLVSVAAQAGIVIISGLALGTDAVAHATTLNSGGKTIAVLAGGLDNISPATNRLLARRIIDEGGLIISEYAPGQAAQKGTFIQRNRLVSGLADAVLITEAAEKSGTLHTARFALEQGRDVMAVPGNINSPNSVGTNNLIVSGAIPIKHADDILLYFEINPTETRSRYGATPEEQTLLDLLARGISDGAELLLHSNLDTSAYNQAITMLELQSMIRPLGNNAWALA